MFKSNKIESSEVRHKLQVWRCDGCSDVHFKTENVLLNFSKIEFAELAHAVMDIYQQEFGGLEFYRLITMVSGENEIQVSETVA